MSRPVSRSISRPLVGLYVAAFVSLCVVLSPSISAACSVCTAGRDEENAAAFLISTIFMSVLPLLAIGTLVFVLWRRIQKLEAETAPSRPPEELAN